MVPVSDSPRTPTAATGGPNGDESLMTLMIYLNGGARGGETRFENATITPEAGLALIFDHYLLHEGALVVEGQKYVLRSDVMYGAPSLLAVNP